MDYGNLAIGACNFAIGLACWENHRGLSWLNIVVAVLNGAAFLVKASV